MKKYVISEETANIMRHILHNRAAYYDDPSTKCAYRNAANMLEYLLYDWTEQLREYDYISDEEISDR